MWSRCTVCDLSAPWRDAWAGTPEEGLKSPTPTQLRSLFIEQAWEWPCQLGCSVCLGIGQSEVRWQLFRKLVVCSACCQHLLTCGKLPLGTAPPPGGWGGSGPIQTVARRPESSGSDNPVCLSAKYIDNS